MASVTGGKIAYSRTVRPADFESANATAEFTFVLTEGDDPTATLAELGDKLRVAVLALVEQHGAAIESPRSDASQGTRRRFRRRGEDLDDEIPF